MAKQRQIGVRELARKAGISAAAVSVKLRKGMSPAAILEKSGRKLKIAQRTGKVDRRHFGTGAKPGSRAPLQKRIAAGETEDWDSANLREKIAKADAQEMANRVRLGTLIEQADVAWFFGEYAKRQLDLYAQFAGNVRDAAAAETNPAKCGEILERELDRMRRLIVEMEELWNRQIGKRIDKQPDTQTAA